MTRKEICENTYCLGGLIGAVIVFIVVFICHGNDPLLHRFFLSLIMMIISPGVCGVVLGGIVFILTLPFYRSIPWDVEESLEVISDSQEINEPINNRWEILDIRE
jgi:hypothetical protein